MLWIQECVGSMSMRIPHDGFILGHPEKKNWSWKYLSYFPSKFGSILEHVVDSRMRWLHEHAYSSRWFHPRSSVLEEVLMEIPQLLPVKIWFHSRTCCGFKNALAP